MIRAHQQMTSELAIGRGLTLGTCEKSCKNGEGDVDRGEGFEFLVNITFDVIYG